MGRRLIVKAAEYFKLQTLVCCTVFIWRFTCNSQQCVASNVKDVKDCFKCPVFEIESNLPF